MEVHGFVISRAISTLSGVISIVTILITLLITTHEPPIIPKPQPQTRLKPPMNLQAFF